MDKKYLIFRPSDRVARMCADKFDQKYFCSEVTVKIGQETHVASAWEVTLQELRQVHNDALSLGFTVDFEVLVRRQKTNTLRVVAKSEWHEPSKKRAKENKQIKSLLQQRKKRLGFGHSV